MVKPVRSATARLPDAAQAAGHHSRELQQLRSAVDSERAELNREWTHQLPAMRACGLCEVGEYCHHCHGYGVVLTTGEPLIHEQGVLYLRLQREQMQGELRRLKGQRRVLRDLRGPSWPNVYPENSRGAGGAQYAGD